MQTRLFFLRPPAFSYWRCSTMVAHHAFASEFDGSKPVTLKGTRPNGMDQSPRVAPHGSERPGWQSSHGRSRVAHSNALLRRGWN